MFAFVPVPPTHPVFYKLIGYRREIGQGAEVVMTFSAGWV